MTDTVPTGIETGRVSKMLCVNCQTTLDVGHLPSFSEVKCPNCGTPQKVPARFGSFLLVGKLGSGGMGVIYQAMDRELGRLVALKVMNKSLGENAEFVRSFKREAQAAASLNHRNVVQIYSFGQHEGQPYIVMELVAGGRLDDMIASGVPLEETRVLEIFRAVAEGLKAASNVGLVHGDIKPANILFGQDNEPKVVDFGLASYIGQQQQQSGAVWGTPYYIAPEKVRYKKVDFRSDIYSLGATLFHTLAGQPPFDGDTPTEVVLARLNKPAPSLAEFCEDVHPETVAMVARMLEADPTMRYPSYPALLVDINAAWEASAKPLKKKSAAKSSVSPLGRGTPTPPRQRMRNLLNRLRAVAARRQVRRGAAIVLAALLLAGAGAAWYRHHTRVAAEQLDQQNRAAALEQGRKIRNQIKTLSALIQEQAAPILPLGETADRVAAIKEAEEPALRAGEAVERIAASANAAEDLNAFAEITLLILEAAPNAAVSQAQVETLQSYSDQLTRLYNLIDETKGEPAEALKEATAIQARVNEAQNRSRQAAAQEAAWKRKEAEARKLAEKKAQEMERQKPILIQRELDRVDEARAANAPLIAQRKFAEAAQALEKLQPELTLTEAQAYGKAVLDTYQALEKLKMFVVKSVGLAPYRGGWASGDKLRDIVRADERQGLTIALGPAGNVMVAWDQVPAAPWIKITQHYLQSQKLADNERAEILSWLALFCYESGVLRTAGSLAGTAAQLNPALEAELQRLMPDLAGTAPPAAEGESK